MNTNSKISRKSTILQKTIVVWALALICCALWGSAFPCIKIGYQMLSIPDKDSASQILFAGTRFLLAGILAVIFASLQARRPILPTKSSIPKILILCLFQTILQYIFFYIGLAHTTGVKGSIIGGTSNFIAILVAAFLFRQERFTTSKLIGCTLGFLGLVLVNLGGLTMSFSFHLNGEGFMLFSAVSYAMSTVCLRRFSQNENPVMLSGYQFIVGGIIMILIGWLMGGHMQFTGFSDFLLIFYMAIISSVAYSLWGILLKYNPVSRITVFGFMTNVFGVLLSAVFLREYDSINIWCFIALILVCSGIIIVNRSKAQTA